MPADPRSGRDRAERAEKAEAAEDEALEEDLRRARRPGLVTVPESLRGGRVVASGQAVVSVLVLVVAVACAFVLRVLWVERAAVGEPMQEASRVQVASGGSSGGFGGEGAGGGGAATRPVASATASAQVVVHVVGAVRKPGLVRLPAGSRVAEAIAAAGGASRRADLTQLNLARVVADGEQVHVPRPGEVVSAPPGGVAGGGAGGGGGLGAAGGGLVNLNTADLAALDSLPGVGPVLAQRILDWRAENGRFTSVEELGEVSGIGDKIMDQLRSKATV